MTVGIENTAHNDNTTLAGTTSVTISAFTVTNANALCVGISFITIGGTPPSSITAVWDSGGTNQSMTQIVHATNTGLDAYIFALLAPTTGAKTLLVSWTNAANWGIGVAGLTGVPQVSLATSFTNATTNTGTGTAASVTVPTSANGGVFGIAVDKDPNSTASGVSNTVLFLGNGVPANNAGDFVSNYQISSNSTSVTLSYTLGSANWAYAGINISPTVTLQWGFEQYNQYQSPYSTVKNTHRAGSIRGKSGFAIYASPFKEGWQVQPPQPPFQPSIGKRSAAFSHPEDGIEGLYINFHPSGWEIQPPQPPRWPLTQQKGSILKGNDGIEGKFIKVIPNWQEFQAPQLSLQPKTSQKAPGALSWWEDGIEFPITYIVKGWEIQPWQPPAQPTVKQKYPGTKGKTTAAVYSPWVNGGWEVQPYQPPSYPKTSQKLGALSQWEDGIEGIYVFVSPVQVNWGYDFQLAPLKVNYRSGSWTHKTEGIDSPYVNFNPSGWEIQPPPPPHTFIEKRGSILKGDDGAEGKYINFHPSGWEVQPYQPPSYPKTSQKLGALSQWEDGIEGVYVFNSPNLIRWNFDIQQPPLKVNYRSGSWSQKTEGIEAPLINSISKPTGWEVQPWQPPLFPKTTTKYSGAVSWWENGIEGKIFFGATLNWGFELQSGWQPPTYPKTNQKLGSLSQWEDGIEGVYVFNAPPPIIWGFDVQSEQLKVLPTNSQKYSGIKGKSGFAIVPLWFNSGWEIQPPQPPAYPKTSQKLGALSQWEDGIEAVYVFNAPPPIIWAFDTQQPPLKINYRGNAWSQKTEGIDGPFILPPPSIYGWEIRPPEVRLSPIMSQRASAIKGKSEFAIYSTWINSGWEVQPYQPPTYPTTQQKLGALSQSENGTEGLYVFVPPPGPVQWGWDQIPLSLKPIYNKYHGIEGKSEFASFGLFPVGWEVQPYQPPSYPTTKQKLGALSQWEDGIEGVYVFVAPPVTVKWGYDFQQPPLKINYRGGAWSQWEDGIEAPIVFRPYDWDLQPPQPPPYPTTKQKLGALSQWEDGIEGKFVFVSPPTIKWNFDIQQPPLKVNYRSGSWSHREDGIEGLYINFHPSGWEVQPPQPPFSPKINQKTGALSHPEEGIEGKYVFNAPPQIIWSFDFQQPPLKVNYRGGAWSQWEDGIEYPFFNQFRNGWEIQPWQPPAYPTIYQKYGALSHPEEGIEGVYVPPPPVKHEWGFEFQTPWQPPSFPKINQRGTAIKGKSEFAIYPPTINAGWEIQWVQPPTYPTTQQKSGAISQATSIESKFVFVAPPQPKWGWDQVPLSLKPIYNKYHGIEGKSEFASFSPLPAGWEIQWVQPPKYPTTQQKYGAISQNEDGSQSKFVFVAPPPITWGYDFQQSLLKINYRSGAWSHKEDGIELFYTNFNPSGWEIQPLSPSHTFVEKRGNVLRGDDGVQYPFINPFRNGWEIQPPQPPSYPKISQKIGALSHPEEGIEGKYVFIAPPFFTDSWEIQSFQPPHLFFEKKGAILRGDDGIEYIFNIFFKQGWEIQPFQPPFFLKPRQRIAGATSQWEDGVEGKYVFVPPPPISRGWDPILPIIPKWLKIRQLLGALSKWEDGNEGIYVFVPPIPPIPPTPPPSPAVLSGLRFQDMQVLGIAPTSTLYWDYGNTEDFYVFQAGALYRVSPRFAFNWFGTTPNVTTIYNPFLSSILFGGSTHFSDDNE